MPSDAGRSDPDRSRQGGSWRTRATHPDPDTAAAVWADPAAPRAVLAGPPEHVVAHLLAAHCGRGLLIRVLRNPAVPSTVLAALAARARGAARRLIVEHALDGEGTTPGRPWMPASDLRVMRTLAAAITPAELESVVRHLLHGTDFHTDDEQARHARLAELLRAFTGSADPVCRRLAAQAFPLTLAPRHSPARGLASAPKLLSDPDTGVRVALARSPYLKTLPEDDDGLRLRAALLADPEQRVRAAARGNGVQVLHRHVAASLTLAHGGTPAAEDEPPPDFGDPLHDPSPAVRATVVRGGVPRTDGRRWARIVTDPSARVRRAAAVAGFWTPRFAWTALARDDDATVRAAVASSRWAPAHLQRRLLSDPDPAVASAARRRDPLARAITAGPAIAEEAVVGLPVSPIADHRVRFLDATVVGLTDTDLADAARHARHRAGARDLARDRVSRALRGTAHENDAAFAWTRWSRVLGLDEAPDTVVRADYSATAPWQKPAARAHGAHALFDAVLAVLVDPAATPDPAVTRADRALLLHPWTALGLPDPLVDTLIAPTALYGPRTAQVRDLLGTAVRLPHDAVDAMLRARIGIDDTTWNDAASAARHAAAAATASPRCSRSLHHDARMICWIATGEAPDALLADALWGAAATAAWGADLAADTVEVLTRPWREGTTA